MRVLMVLPDLRRRGSTVRAALAAAGLPRGRFEVHICALGGGCDLTADLGGAGVPVYRVDSRSSFEPRRLRRLQAMIARLGPDVVHAWTLEAGRWAFPAAWLAGVQTWVWDVAPPAECRTLGQALLDRWIVGRTARLVVGTPTQRQMLLSLGAAPRQCVEIPAGVATAPADTAPPRAALLSQLALPPTARLVGTAGRLTPARRIKDLIWAADLLKVIRDDLHLLVLGDGPHRRRLELFRRQCEIEDRVHLLGHRGDAPKLLAALDALWLSGGGVGISQALLEAMAAGVPAIVADTPDHRLAVEHGECGYLFAPGDRASLARHTRRLLGDEQLRRRLGAAAQRRMLERFAAEAMIARYAELYAALV